MKKLWTASILIGCLASASCVYADTLSPAKMQTAQNYEVKDYSGLLGMPGFSKTALELHFKLYQGYVKNTNLLYSLIQDLAANGRDHSPEYAELKRRFGWEFDGMRLHELYFDNLGGKKPLDPKSKLYARIVKDFGSYEKWQEDFFATGEMRGIGWAVLYLDPRSGRLFNIWVNEHDVGHLAGGTPLLIMDVFEHAYMLDYQLDRPAYIKAFFNNIQWDAVTKRYPEMANAMNQ